MIHDHIQAELAAERRRALLAEAEAARRIGPARLHRYRPGTPAARRPLFRWLADRLLAGWNARLSGPRSAVEGERTEPGYELSEVAEVADRRADSLMPHEVRQGVRFTGAG